MAIDNATGTIYVSDTVNNRIRAIQTVGPGFSTSTTDLSFTVYQDAAAALVQTHGQFYIIGLLAGAVLGANQATSRALLGRFTPAGRQGEFFGFFSVTGKFAAVIGPMVYGEVTAWTGSQRWAIVSMAVFFAIGLAALQPVNEQRGMAAAMGSS